MDKTNCLIGRILMSAMAGFLIIGSIGCKQEETPVESRRLKRAVSVGKITARDIKDKEGQVFPFEMLSNALFTSAIANNRYFYRRELMVQDSDHAISGLSKTGDLSPEMGILKIIPVEGDKNYCLRDYPQIRLEGEIYDFALTGKNGFGIGYKNGVGGWGINFGMASDTYTLDMAIAAYDAPMYDFSGQKSNSLIGQPHIVRLATKANFSLDFSIPIASFGFNTERYFQLTQVIREAFDLALDQLNMHFDSEEYRDATKWYAETYSDEGAEDIIQIKAGSNAGLRKGDIVRVDNYVYRWETGNFDQFGGPCKGAVFLGATDAREVGVFEVEKVYNLNMAQARLLKWSETGERPHRQMGSRATLVRFADEPSKP